jgi:hypothetical protein
MRRILANARQPGLMELTCASLRLPILNRFAWHVFFGRGSFPDINFEAPQQVAVGAD